MVGQFVDVNPAIGQDAAISIDVANAGGGGNNTFQTLRSLRSGNARHSFSPGFSEIDFPVAGAA
jgi:hypothetical protein